MIVAMVAVRVVQAAVDEVVHMVAVRDALVAATRPVRVAGSAGAVDRSAAIRVPLGDLDCVFVHVVTVWVVQVAIVQVIDVVVVANCDVPATRTVLMGVVFVFGFIAGRHA